jgi:hypothetical protein
MDNKKNLDEYLSYDEYKGHDKSPDHKDFNIFSKGGEFYFALLDKMGNVGLLSQGYSSETTGLILLLIIEPLKKDMSSRRLQNYFIYLSRLVITRKLQDLRVSNLSPKQNLT